MDHHQLLPYLRVNAFSLLFAPKSAYKVDTDLDLDGQRCSLAAVY